MSQFVDLQVNGFGGVDFSSPSLTVDAVRQVVAALRCRGTRAFCPTVITSSPAVYNHVLPVLARAAEAPDLQEALLGIHLEGPFISPEEGAVGAHPRACVQVPSVQGFDRLHDLLGSSLRLVTLAPEQPGALAVIRRAVECHVRVAIGHTLADADAIHAAVAEGATLSTHLGNGCPNQIHRHRNPLWAQLAAGELTAMIVTDGHHLPSEFVRTVLAAKGAAQVIVTSDASPVAGCPPGEYDLWGTRVRVEPSGRIANLRAETLAGSAATLSECAAWLTSLHCLSDAELRRVTRDNALAVMGAGSRKGDAANQGGSQSLRS